MNAINSDSVSGALGPLSPLTSTFSTSFAQPLKAALPKTYSPGYSGSPRAFFNSILINGDKQLKDCSAQPFKSIDGSPCAYMDNLLYCLVIGIVVPVVTVFYCCGFFCARNGGEKCKCCGAMCRQPNCGGKYPSIAKYSPSETRCCCCGYFLNWIIICIFAVLGFLSTNAASQDIQLVVNSLNSAKAYAPTYKTAMSSRLNQIQSSSLMSLDSSNVNNRLYSVVADTASKVQEASQSMSALISSLKATCDSQNCPTNPQDVSRFQNSTQMPVTFSAYTDRWIAGGAMLATTVTCCPSNASWSGNLLNYSEAYYQNGDLKPDDCIVQSPAIQSKLNSVGGWMCCRCVELSQRLSMCKSNLDRMNSSVQGLNHGIIDRTTLGGAITALASPINTSIDSFDTSMSKISSILVQSSQALTNQAAIVGGSATVWALAIISVSCALFGLLLSISCCWWTSYCLGVVNVIVFFVLFGAFALISLPFGDLCSGIPKTGDSITIQQTWLLTFSAQGRLSDLKPDYIGIYTGCLIPTPPAGNLFRVSGRDKNNITGALKTVTGEFTVSEALIALDVGTYTSLFAESVELVRSNFSTFETVQTSLLSTVKSIQDLKEKAATSFALISGIISDRGSVISNTSDMIWSAANCSGVNNLYEGFRQPLCNRMSKSLDSIWVLFFFIGVAWFPMFCIICRSSKHSLARKGVYDIPVNDDDLNMKDIRDDKDEESGIQESPETPVDGSMKEKVKRKKSKKKSSTASSHISADEGDEDAALERKKKAK
mmetsp:Transcript_28420/g.59426  ORF Transcript_28420/g.59426 Transcript_28420/m.59426 type:complete len:770 (-) Transcript_28420:232-2541(-)|eukprot:CAMPEP_0172195516 /NCGR_PEP_ID=MMETSP1050-20130122/26253_1 /TAXON_ID=233186 /ORGANISM="Cryptomonas curvata, Strain CCAP979/52" /LENGTH=769 /DNA_ID=CAMNT_0012871591 /DNA_START=124 /DNA_END=2433 /DNA_ORIENTATION=+